VGKGIIDRFFTSHTWFTVEEWLDSKRGAGFGAFARKELQRIS